MMRTLTQVATAVGTAVAVAGLLAACGGSTATTPAAAASTATAQEATGVSAYLSCLRQHGANVPTAIPTGGFRRPNGSGSPRPSGVRGSGGFGGFGGLGQNPQDQAALQACASVRPTTGFGGFGRGGTQLTAFRNCMAQQGVTIPTTRPTTFPTGSPSPGLRFLNGLDPSDPKVVAALKVCEPLLPSQGARPTGTATN